MITWSFLGKLLDLNSPWNVFATFEICQQTEFPEHDIYMNPKVW